MTEAYAYVTEKPGAAKATLRGLVVIAEPAEQVWDAIVSHELPLLDAADRALDGYWKRAGPWGREVIIYTGEGGVREVWMARVEPVTAEAS